MVSSTDLKNKNKITKTRFGHTNDGSVLAHNFNSLLLRSRNLTHFPIRGRKQTRAKDYLRYLFLIYCHNFKIQFFYFRDINLKLK